MSTIINNAFAINGVVSTDRTVLQNITTLCSAANAWITYDISDGLWSVVINEPSAPVVTFNDSMILGGINVSGTGIGELYNEVSIEFPHRDLRDQTDYIDLSIAAGDRLPNELDNRLNISLNCINNPVQAQYIASVQLKQSRADKVIEFRSDYNVVGLKAGDIIAVTKEVYGYTNKAFRIVKLEESDEEFFSVSISALEYDPAVYDDSDLVFTSRNKKTGIVPKASNTALSTNDNQATATESADGFNGLLTAAAISTLLAAGIGPLFEYLKTTSDVAKAGTTAQNPGTTIPTYAAAYVNVPGASVLGQFNAFAGLLGPEDTDWQGTSEAFVEFTFTVPIEFNSLLFFVDCPLSDFIVFDKVIAFDSYTNVPFVDQVVKTQFPELSAPVVTDIVLAYLPKVVDDAYVINEARDVSAYVPMLAQLFYNQQLVDSQVTSMSNPSLIFNYVDAPPGDYTLIFRPVAAKGTFNFDVLHGYYGQVGEFSGMSVKVLGFTN